MTSVCYIEPESAYDIFNPDKHLEIGEHVIAFSAIGQPQQFYKFLKDYAVLKTIDFDDHHNYSQIDTDKLAQICADLEIKSLVTTEKDAVKLKKMNFKDLNVFALKLQTNLDVEILLRL